MKNIDLLYAMVLSFPQYRRIILSGPEGLERCIHFLINSNTNLFKTQ